MQTAVFPILVFAACVVALAVALLGVANLFSPSRPGRVKRMPYESGMDPVHDARRRFDVPFHLLAIAFLVFDVELLFLYPWAVAISPARAEGGVAAVRDADGGSLTNAEQPEVVGPAGIPGWRVARHGDWHPGHPTNVPCWHGVSGDAHVGLRLRLAEGGVPLAVDLPDNVVVAPLDALASWCRKNSLWPMPFATACCGIELMATGASRHDLARFGAEVFRFSPRSAI